MTTQFRQRITSNEVLTGMLLSLDSGAAAEAAAMSGLDWVFIDAEHAPLSITVVQDLVRSASSYCGTAIRIPQNNSVEIKRALDTGCDCIVVPQIISKEDAQEAVNSAMYPPLGSRSVGISRAHRYGLGVQDYIDTANDNIAIVLQIEHIQGVNNIEEILQVSGVDAVFIGPYDLSGSMDLTGKVSDDRVQEAIGRTITAAKSAGVPVGAFTTTVEGGRELMKRGVTLLAVGVDAMCISRFASEITSSLVK